MITSKVWDFELSHKVLTETNKYQRLQLSRNPFPSVAVARETPLYPPLSAIDKSLQDLLIDFVVNKESQMAVIIGEYGSGKTHTLRLIQEKLEEPGSPLKPKIVYIASAGYEMYSLLRNILDGFGRDEITKTIWRLLLEDIDVQAREKGYAWLHENFGDPKSKTFNAMQGRLEGLTQEQQILTSAFTQDDFLDYRIFLKKFTKRGFSVGQLRNYAIKFLSGKLECSPLIAAELFDATDNDVLRSQAAWDKLTVQGEKGSPYKPEKEADVMLLVLNLTTYSGNYDSFVLLVDEFEAVVAKQVTTKQSDAYLRSLRLIFDKTASLYPYITIMAANSEAWETAVKVYPPLTGRVTRIDLPKIDTMLAIEVVSNYLKNTRLNNPDTSEPDALFPLTGDIVAWLSELSGLKTVKDIITYCRELIEYLANNPSIPLPVELSAVKEYSAKWANPNE